jgi:hypothetical protein
LSKPSVDAAIKQRVREAGKKDTPEKRGIEELAQAIEVVLVHHRGPAIQRLQRAYEALQ